MNREFPRESNAVNFFGREEYTVRSVSMDFSGPRIPHWWVLGNQDQSVLGSVGQRPLT